MPEDPGDFFDNGQPETQPAILMGPLHVAAFELLENFLQFVLGNPDTGIPDLDGQTMAMPTATQYHPASGGVSDGVAQQVAQNPREQLDIAAYQRRARHERQAQALAGSRLRELDRQVFQQFAQGKRRDIGLDYPGIQLGDIDQRPEQILHVFQRIADITHQDCVGLRFAALQQGTGKQPGRIERLKQIMADGGQKLGFRQVGLLGFELGFTQARLDPTALVDLAQQLAVQGGQLGGALADSLLEVLISLVQRFGGTATFGDIADQDENADHFTIGQAIGHIGAQHVALLIVDVDLGAFEGHAFPRKGAFDIGFQALVMLFAVDLAQVLSEHHATRPTVPLFIDLVGELIDQVGVQVDNQRRHMVGDQADPALALAEGFSMLVAFGDVRKGVDEAAGG